MVVKRDADIDRRSRKVPDACSGAQNDAISRNKSERSRYIRVEEITKTFLADQSSPVSAYVDQHRLRILTCY